MSEHVLMRETDRWLRRFAIIGPIVAYMVGTMTGFVGAAWMFRDHEKRISFTETWQRQHDADDKTEKEKTDGKLERLSEFQAKVSLKLGIPR